jgi:hypothetical protein
MKYIKILLVLFVVVSLGYLVAKNVYNTSPTKKSTPDQVQGAEHLEGVVVYYFHGNRRCYTCNTIEKYTSEVIAPYVIDKKLKWDVINIQEPKQSHFIKEFDLSSSGPVIVEYAKGKITRWRALNKVWQLVKKKDVFFNYIQNEVSSFLEKKNNG